MGSISFSSNRPWGSGGRHPLDVVHERLQITASKQDSGDESKALLPPKETPRARGQGTKGNGSSRSICVQLLQKSKELWRVHFIPQREEEIQV